MFTNGESSSWILLMKRGESFPAFLERLKAWGVTRDNSVKQGRVVYHKETPVDEVAKIRSTLPSLLREEDKPEKRRAPFKVNGKEKEEVK